MTSATPEELKNALMRGHQMTSAELDAFLAANPREGQLHDYKGGELTERANRGKGVRTIREWVTGFANAEGGVLIIGPGDKPPHKITGCQKIGNEEVADWAQKGLVDVAGMFSPAPRFCTVQHPDGEVLLIATERAPQLIPVIESRQWTYYLRINTSTVQVPEYLISDLVLGRRKHPGLDLKLHTCRWTSIVASIGQNVRKLDFTFTVENRSLVRAEKIQVGIVGWTAQAASINDYVLAYVDAEEPKIDLGGVAWSKTVVSLSDREYGLGAVAPFDQKVANSFLDAVSVPCHTARLEHGEPFTLYRCGVYVVAEGSPPSWFQLDVTIRNREHDPEPQIVSKGYRVAYGARPVLACFLGTEAHKVFQSLGW